MKSQGRGCKSLDIRRSFDLLDRRRSVELGRSTRRYDEHWGAAERSDARIKCGDNIIHHCHSQIISAWSPVLRDMISLYPTPALLESTHGLAYLVHVEEDAAVWSAVLDMMYPVPPQQQQPLDWGLLESCLLLVDKYGMSCLLQRISASLLDPARSFSMDPIQPSFALRWLGIAERLQLPEVAARIQAFLKPSLAELGSQPAAMSAVLAYAQEHLSKEQLLQLLSLSMQQPQQPQQQQQQSAMMLMQQQQAAAAAGAGLLMVMPVGSGQAFSYHQQQMSQQQQQQQQPGFSWPASIYNGAGTSCSGTSCPAAGSAEQQATSDDAGSENGDSNNQHQCGASMQVETEQQRLAMCMSSGLFAAGGRLGSDNSSAAASSRAASPAAAFPIAPVPHFSCSKPPVFSLAAPLPRQQQQQQQQVPVFSMQADGRATATSCGFGVAANGGSMNIAEWMSNENNMQC